MKSDLMKIRLEAVADAEQAAVAARGRREVFGTEWAAEPWRVLVQIASVSGFAEARRTRKPA